MIFGAALVVRTYRLHEFPPGLHNDEAANGLDVLNILEGKNSVFFPRNQGREPLFIYLQAAVVALLGATPYALRLTAAIIGALAVPAAYWMVREAFVGSTLGPRRLATWTALFMAFGYWHISMSRIGFRANMLPLLAAITFALFWRAWRKLTEEHKFPTLWLILTGVALGVSLYTYTAARMLPVLVVIVAGFSLFQRGMTGKQRLQVIGAVAMIAVVSAVVFAPLGLYYLQHPDAFIGRTAAVFVFNPSAEGDGAPATLPETVLQTALMFFASADPNLRHNPAAQSATDFVLGLWLVAGIFISVIRWRRRPYFFLLAWFVLFSLPAVLSSEGIPHSLRAIGMIPIVYVLPVVAMVLAGQWLTPRWHILRNWLPLPFLLFSATTSVYSYFSVWSDLREFDGAFLGNYVQLADDLGAHGSADSVWLLPLSPNYFNITKTFWQLIFSTMTQPVIRPCTPIRRLQRKPWRRN
ncbi:MAG: phospholipid carrier-dependent glycosyltransferase [Anaerolineales bacterium]|nr:phospholipid carrier-dependent glycosyltransferase [Anaerolineales bacterium]